MTIPDSTCTLYKSVFVWFDSIYLFCIYDKQTLIYPEDDLNKDWNIIYWNF